MKKTKKNGRGKRAASTGATEKPRMKLKKKTATATTATRNGTDDTRRPHATESGAECFSGGTPGVRAARAGRERDRGEQRGGGGGGVRPETVFPPAPERALGRRCRGRSARPPAAQPCKFDRRSPSPAVAGALAHRRRRISSK